MRAETPGGALQHPSRFRRTPAVTGSKEQCDRRPIRLEMAMTRAALMETVRRRRVEGRIEEAARWRGRASGARGGAGR